jgi:hypothetical protein
MTKPPLTWRKLLLAAAELIHRKGWCQRVAARNRAGTVEAYDSKWAVRFCPLGAFWRVSKQANLTDPLYRSAMDALCAVVGRRVISWNDARGRTKAEVVAAMRKAARSRVAGGKT